MTSNKNLYKRGTFLMQDIAIIVLSIFIAVVLIKTNVISEILLSTKQLEIFGSFFAGMFFTTIFTTAPAIVTLADISQHHSVFWTALFGSFGAVIGDLIIFQFVKDRLSEHLIELVSHNTLWKKARSAFRLKYFRYFTFLFGGLLIASPLPDELGIGLLGFTKMSRAQFIAISLVFNFIGILAIGLVANSI